MCVFPMAITRTRDEHDAPDEYSSSVPQSLGRQRASLLSEPSNPPTYIPDEEALSSCRLENQLAALASWRLAAFRISSKITENKTKHTERDQAQAATRSSDTLRDHALCLTHTY